MGKLRGVRAAPTKKRQARKLYSHLDWKRPSGEEEVFSTWRPPIMRDWGRIIHSASFRRLQGKTQLFPGHESDFFRNRLTHSLEVAQIAEGIALRLNHVYPELKGDSGIDPRVCAAAALLHDIGHPPFGHNGERALDDCMKSYGGFEGNAQSLRIVSVIEKKKKAADGSPFGLDLTYRLLAAILKYDQKISARRATGSTVTKGYYASEANLVAQIKRHVAPGWRGRCLKTIECQIMDIADDIAYSVFDLEDTFKAGFVDPSTILSGSHKIFEAVANKASKSLKKKISDVDVYFEFADMFECIEAAERYDSFLIDFTEAASASRALASDGYLRTQLSSQLVGMAISSVTLRRDFSFPMLSKVSLSEEAARRVEILKHYNFEATVRSPRVKIAEYRGYEIVKSIFDALDSTGGYLLMPDDVKAKFEEAELISKKKRVICDFIAGMTDKYAVEFVARLHSDTAQSIFKPF